MIEIVDHAIEPEGLLIPRGPESNPRVSSLLDRSYGIDNTILCSTIRRVQSRRHMSNLIIDQNLISSGAGKREVLYKPAVATGVFVIPHWNCQFTAYNYI